MDFNDAEFDEIFEARQDDDENLPEATESIEKMQEGKVAENQYWKHFQIYHWLPQNLSKPVVLKSKRKDAIHLLASCGVSVQDVRDHLIKVVPDLKDHGISETSVRYLFKPVRST